MKTWVVSVREITEGTVEVKAKTKEEAIEMALEITECGLADIPDYPEWEVTKVEEV